MMARVLEASERQCRACERRRAQRVAMRVPIIIYSAGRSDVTSLYFSENISSGGLFLASERGAFQMGEKLYLEFSMPLQIVARRIRVIARVAHRCEGQRGGYGLRFEKIFQSDQYFLMSYLSSLRMAS